MKGRSVSATDAARAAELDGVAADAPAGSVVDDVRQVMIDASWDLDAAGRLWVDRFGGRGPGWEEALDALLDAEDDATVDETAEGAVVGLLEREAARMREMADRLEQAGVSPADADEMVGTFNRITMGAWNAAGVHEMSIGDAVTVVDGLSAAIDPVTGDWAVLAAAQWSAEQHGSLAAAARVGDERVQDLVAAAAPGSAWVGLDTYTRVEAEVDFPDGSGATRRTVSGLLRGHAPSGERRRLTSDRGFEVFVAPEQVVSLKVVRENRPADADRVPPNVAV